MYLLMYIMYLLMTCTVFVFVGIDVIMYFDPYRSNYTIKLSERSINQCDSWKKKNDCLTFSRKQFIKIIRSLLRLKKN